MLLADLRDVQQTHSGMDELRQCLYELDERLNVEAETVHGLIARNAWSRRIRTIITHFCYGGQSI